MITYKTSDLFRRAKQLADLEGSNFVSWNESINAINESYVGLYEKLISCGDNSYVKSFRMATGTEKLPEDFWQLKGVYLWNNGNLQTINRRADNSGIHHLSYELRNGEINLYGNPNDVLVEYYPKPMTLTYKPNDVDIGLESGTYLDCHKHCFVYEDTDTEENETLSIIDLDGYKTVKDFVQVEHSTIDRVVLTEDYCVVITTSNMKLYQLSTGILKTINVTNEAPLITESGNLYFVSPTMIENQAYIIEYIITEDALNIKIRGEMNNIITSGKLYVCNDDFTDFFFIGSNNVYYHMNAQLTKLVNIKKLIYKDTKCYFLGSQFFGFTDQENNIKVIDNAPGIPVGFIGIDERTGFGYCVKRFNNYIVRPYCEDTLLDFPNSFYYQILSYLLAINMKAKQGADTSLLAQQLAMAEQNFEETLGSDAFQFPRMGNVYN